MLIDVQLNPSRNTWSALRDATQAAESAGFAGAWVYDHLAGRSLGGTHMFEAFTLLGALAATTSRIELGTLVANVANRQPAVLAVAAASLDAIGARRVLLGVGAGTSPHSAWAAEMHAVGQEIEPTLAGRHARVERTLDLLDAVWAPDRPDELATFPRCSRPPLVLVGLNSVPLAQLAGRRSDGINVAWDHPDRDTLLDAAVEARGSRNGFCLTTWTPWDDGLLDPDHPQRQTMERRGIDRLVLVELGPADADRIAALLPNGSAPGA